MSKQTNTRPSWAKNAAKSVKYTAEEVVSNRMPFTTNTVRNMIDTGKDMSDWLKRNNPFKSVSGSKDPMIRRITNAAKRTFDAGVSDLKTGDLQFKGLQKEINSSFGEDEFGEFDFGFGDDDTDWNFDENGEESSTSFSNQNLNSDFREYAQMTSNANVAAIGESTSQISTATFRAADAATNRIIAANLANFTKLTTQISGISGSLTTLDKNVAQLVEATNDTTKFLSQSQQFMEHTEQTLNDIKAIMIEMHDHITGANRVKSREWRDYRPEFLQNGFDPKGYMKHIMDNTMVGMFIEMGVPTILDALKLERPEFLKDAAALPLSALLQTDFVGKLFPGLKKLGEFDEILSSSVETFFNKLDAGDYNNPALRLLGMFGFGVEGARKGKYNSKNYIKGATAWTGKSERALQEVIPNYLSHMERDLQLIAKTVTRKNSGSKRERDTLRTYDYDTGTFTDRNEMIARAQKEMNNIAYGAFWESYDKIEKIVEAGNKKNEAIINEWLKEFMKDENATPGNEMFKKFVKAISAEGNVELTPEEQLKLYNTLLQNRNQAIRNLGDFRKSGSNRDNYLYNIGDRINNLSAEFEFQGGLSKEERRMKGMSEEERRNYERQLRAQEGALDAFSGFINKIKDSDIYHFMTDYMENGGPLSKFLSGKMDKLEAGIISKVNQISVDELPRYATGNADITTAHIAVLDENERVLNAKNKQLNDDMIASASTIREVADGMTRSSKRSGIEFKSRRRRNNITEAEADLLRDVTNEQIERARTPEEEARETQAEIADNIRTLTALAVGVSEENGQKRKKTVMDKIKEFLFGEKGEDGFYHGKFASGFANRAIDIKNYLLNILNGQGYVKSTGEIVEAREDNLKTFASDIKDEGAKIIYGGEDSDKYKAYLARKEYMRQAAATTSNNPIQSATESAEREISNATADMNNAVFGGSNSQEIRDSMNDALQSQNEMTKGEAIRRGLLGAGIGFGVSSLVGNSAGLLTKIFMPGGPIGGAFVGAGISILSKNKTFLDTVFGREENGERVGGIISKDLQERYKGMSKKFLGAGAIGALAGSLLPSAVSTLSLGALGTTLIGSGPIGGAVLGVAAMLLSKSKAVQESLFGKDNDNTLANSLKEQKAAIKRMLIDGKKSFIAGGAGAGIGALVGSIIPSILGMNPIGGLLLGGSLGAVMGVYTITDKFKNWMFGEEYTEFDKNGKLVTRRDGGFLGQLSRRLIVNTVRPLNDFGNKMSKKFVEWVRYDIKDQLDIIFSPIVASFQIKFKSLTDILTKPFKALGNAVTGVANMFGTVLKGSLTGAFKFLGGAISAPLKLLAGIRTGIGMNFGGRKKAQKDFIKEYNKPHLNKDGEFEDGTKHRAINKFVALRKSQLDKKIESTGAKGIKKFGMQASSFIGTTAEVAKANLAPMLPAFFKSKIYDNARTDFAEKNGFGNDKIFMAGVTKNKHKRRENEIDREAKKREAATKFAQTWAKEDKYNDKIEFAENTLNERNAALRKIYGKDFKNLNQSEMIDFIYNPDDPMAKKKKKADQEAIMIGAQQATIDTKDKINDLAKALTSGGSGYFINLGNTFDETLSKYFEVNDEPETTPDNNGFLSNDIPGQTSMFDQNPDSTINPDIAIGPGTKSMDDNGFADSYLVTPSTEPVDGNIPGQTSMFKQNPTAKTSDDTKSAEPITVNLSEESINGITNPETNEDGEGIGGLLGGFSNLLGKKGLIALAIGAVGIPAIIAGVKWFTKTFPGAVDDIKYFAGKILNFLQNPVEATKGEMNESEFGDKNAHTQTEEQKEAGLDTSATAYEYLSGRGAGTLGGSITGLTGISAALGFDDERFTILNSSRWRTDFNGDGKKNKKDRLIYDNNKITTEEIAQLALMYAANVTRNKKVTETKDSTAKIDKDELMEFINNNEDVIDNFMLDTINYNLNYVTDQAGASSKSDRLTYIKAASQKEIDKALAYVNNTKVEELPSEGGGIGYGHFTQTDPRWGGRRFSHINKGGYTTMANGGCGPTALANVAIQSGINVTPDKIASMAVRNGYTSDGGSNARLFNEGASRLGLRSSSIGKGGIKSALARGSKVILAGKGNGNGIYTNAGHIISARGLDKKGNAIVDDPMRKKSISVPLNRLVRGLTNAWSIGRGPSNETETNIDDTEKLSTTDKGLLVKQSHDNYLKNTLNWSDDGKNFRVYYQCDPAWDNKPLGSQSVTIGSQGCVISAMGSVLSDLSGLDFNPVVYTEKLGAYSTLGSMLPDFMKVAASKFPSLIAHDIFYPYQPDKLNSDAMQEAISKGYPMVIFNSKTGSYSDGIAGSVFGSNRDHAKVYKPDVGGESGRVYDPGSQQPAKQGPTISPSELFSQEQGVDRALFYTGDKPSQADKNAAAEWLYGDISGKELLDIASGTPSPTTSSNTNTSSNPSNNYNSSTDSNGESEGFFSWLLNKFSELGKIAENWVESILTGNSYKSIYSGGNSSSGNSSSGSYTSGSNISMYPSGTGEETAKMASEFVSSITEYINAPEWAKKVYDKGSAGLTAIPSSSKLSDDQLRDILTQTIGYISTGETGGSYTTVVANDNGNLAFGVGGFNGPIAVEALKRIRYSGQITDSQLLSDLDKAIAITQRGPGTREEGAFVKSVIEKCGEVNKIVQDTYLTELAMSYMKSPVKAYDDSKITDPRSIVMLSHFGGFGPAYLSRMLNNNPYMSDFINHSMNPDDLTNTTMIMNDYYTDNVGSFVDGHRDRFKRVYQALGGENTTALGFGAGITDSIKSSPHDIIDTPVAINKAPEEFNIDMNPVTSRQDTVINLLTRIVSALNKPNYINSATTSNDNIGGGTLNNQRMKEAGLRTDANIPIYEKDSGKGDILRRIHNRIARSPRPI